MVSIPKRIKYSSDVSSSEDNSEENDYMINTKKTSNQRTRRTSKSTKWLSKNAIMARENRLKKKLYINNLESEVNKLKSDNDKYNRVIETQSMLINELKNEVRYLKSVIANSSDISRLIKNIHYSTAKTTNS